jgi:hypothetical protein
MVYGEKSMIGKAKAAHRTRPRRGIMPVLIAAPDVRACGNSVQEKTNPVPLDDLVIAMGKRLQAEYIEGAIPYMREREPTLWAKLEALDREESLEALLEYERLFFEGLRRYVSWLEGGRQAA